ncbi:MAG: hypothetical protein KIS72_12140, partial [Luteimonas sp.]|nr:hypothetical protein [Luteimonas sp.]
APRKPRLARWGGGAAVAASVALLAVFAGRQLPDPAPAADGVVPDSIVAVGPAASPAPGVIPPPLTAPDAVADAGDRQPAPSPTTPALDPSAVLAAAVAVAEVPRRATERRSRAQVPRAASRLQAQREAEAPVVLAAVAPAIGMPDTGSADDDGHFAMPPAEGVPARPWPRALLPTADNAYTVGFGSLPSELGFEPFRPREIAGAAVPPADEGGLREAPVPASPARP